MDFNQMAIHTLPGCTVDTANETGVLENDDCATKTGCTVEEEQPNSYGASFAQAGGGVWATLFDASGILCVFNSLPFCCYLVSCQHMVLECELKLSI